MQQAKQQNCMFFHSHKKTDSLETQAVLIEIFMLCWNLLSGPKHHGWLQKKPVLSLKGMSSFAGDFMLIWRKQRLIWFSLQRDGTRNGLSNIKETFAENLQLKISILCAKVWAFWSLKFIWWLGKIKCKEKIPDVSDPNQNVETTCSSKLKFT